MQLDRERLIGLVREIENNLLDELRKAMKSLTSEIQWLNSESGYDELIREMSLNSGGMPEGHSSSGSRRDLANIFLEIDKCRKYQQMEHCKSLRKCYAKQTVAFRVLSAVRQLPQMNQPKFWDYLTQTVEYCAKKYHRSKRNVVIEREQLLATVLENVNKNIADIEDYADDD